MERRSLKQTAADAFRLFTNDIRNSKWAIAAVIAYFVLSRSFFYSICPMVSFTGFPCPACGLTRAGFAVLRFDFAGAWRMHPFIYPIIFLIFLFFVNRYFLYGRKGRKLRKIAFIILTAMILFYIWRMYRYFPGEPPMSYYRHNVIQRILHIISQVTGRSL